MIDLSIVAEIEENNELSAEVPNVVYSGGGEGGGADGFSPIVDLSKEGKVTTLSITDKYGKKTVEIRDGEDGYSPIYGVDYFTPADKSELVQSVLNALPTWEGGVY